MDQLFQFVSNHPLLFSALGLVGVLLIANEVHGNVTGRTHRLRVSDAVRLINDRDPLILDLRTLADFKKSHLLNAKSAPQAKLDEAIKTLAKDKARPVLLYCAMGNSAATARDKLSKNGYTEVYHLKGGLNAWLGANMPVTAQ